MSLPITTKEVPFFKLIVPLLLGITCQYLFDIIDNSWWNYIAALLLLAVLFIGYYQSSKWKFRWVFGFILNISLVFFGALLALKQPLNSKIKIEESNKMVLRLLDNPQVRAKSIRVTAEVSSVYSSGSWWSVNDNILVYFDLGDSLSYKLRYGALIAAELKPQEVLQQGNPEQFDFKKYLSNRGILLTAYVYKDKWTIVGFDGNALKSTALNLRDKLVTLFKESGLSGDELAVASALTLGYQDLLDDELRQVYSSSGAMHILSVSGLHVGILYILLSFLLSFLNKKVYTRAIKAIILLCFLWFFALLTGLPPCVQRSALMFSFLVVGDFFYRKANIYNTLASSAFVLLVINPYNLFDIGFQLSYLAVLSIVFFYPFVYKITFFKNWALDKIWSLVAVSIAAQVGTLALTLFYFGQFPNYFLLSNLVAIPLSTIALYLSVLLIIVSPFQWLSFYVGKALSICISWLNHGLEFVEKLPFSVSEGLNISSFQMIILFLVALVIVFFLITKRGRYAIIGLSLLVLFLITNIVYSIEKVKTKEIVVFNIAKKSLVSFRLGENLMFIDNDTTKKDFRAKYDFFIKTYISKVSDRSSLEVFNPFDSLSKKKNIHIFTQKGISIISFNNKIVAIPFDKSIDKCIPISRMEVDFLIINKFCSIKIFNHFKPKTVIVDSSVSKHKAAEIATNCKVNGIPCHMVSTQGAFVKKFI